MKFKIVAFEDVLPIWKNQLWPNRESAIETHSAMTWQKSYDMKVFNYAPHFFAAYDGEKIVGVNSGHRTSETEFRSRGLWVDPEYRGNGIGILLLELISSMAETEGATMCWSIPRVTALKTYLEAGYEAVGMPFDEKMEFGPNIYAINRLK